MRPLAILLAAVLGGCSDGRDRRFTPSQNLAVSHPWLAGAWIGTTTFEGNEWPASLDFDQSLPAGSIAHPLYTGSHAPFSPVRVRFEADGDRARWVFSLYLGPSGPTNVTIVFRGEVVFESQSTMRLTWSDERHTELAGQVTTSTLSSGTGRLTRAASPAIESTVTVETWDLPELWLRVVTIRQR